MTYFVFDNRAEVIRWLRDVRVPGPNNLQHYVIVAPIKASFVDALRETAYFQSEKGEVAGPVKGYIPEIADPGTSYVMAGSQKLFTSFGVPRIWVPHMEEAVNQCGSITKMSREDFLDQFAMSWMLLPQC